MGKWVQAFAFLGALLGAPSAWAAPICSGEANSLFGAPLKNLTRFPGKAPLPESVLNPVRLKKAVTFLGPNDHFNSGRTELQDGVYVFLTDTKGNTAFSNRVIPPTSTGDPTFLGVHEGLLVVMKDHLASESDIISAGEFTVRDGRIVLLTNKSGTFRGDAGHLERATADLAQKDMPFKEGFAKWDYSVSKRDGSQVVDAHEEALIQAQAELAATTDPTLARVLAETQKTLRPSRDFRHQLNEALVQAYLHDPRSEWGESASFALQLLSSWEKVQESEAPILSRSLTRFGEQKIMNALQVIKEITAEIKPQ